MNIRDYIGKRGEAIFRYLITEWCDGEQWFDDNFLGEKQPVKDFIVNLIEPAADDAVFYAQVKATRGKYTGKGPRRQLKVKLSRKGMAMLKRAPGPAYFVGVDINARSAWIVPITRQSPDSISAISLGNPLNCATIKKLWEEVDKYWLKRSMLPPSSTLDI